MILMAESVGIEFKERGSLSIGYIFNVRVDYFKQKDLIQVLTQPQSSRCIPLYANRSQKCNCIIFQGNFQGALKTNRITTGPLCVPFLSRKLLVNAMPQKLEKY